TNEAIKSIAFIRDENARIGNNSIPDRINCSNNSLSRDTSSTPGLVVDPERDAGFTIHVTMVQSETAAISVVRSKSPIRIWQHAGRHTVEIAGVCPTAGARGGGGEMKKKAVPTWPHAPDEAIMAIIIAWDDGLGVSYSYRNGAAEAGPIGPTDWP